MGTQRRKPAGRAPQRELPGLGDLLILEKVEVVEQGDTPLHDIAFVAEEMEFSRTGTQLHEKVEITTLDDSGCTVVTKVAIDIVN
ncbi:MAG: hypothetical protein KDJ47_03685 [Hyphomicrobiaceae bacterium]|nr:hypothetical protein [Hyphomicrobiaceae bacterium]